MREGLVVAAVGEWVWGAGQFGCGERSDVLLLREVVRREGGVVLVFHVSLLVFVIDVRHELVKLGVIADCVEVLVLDRHLIVILAIVESHFDFHLL